jgi:hypothetical protein
LSCVSKIEERSSVKCVAKTTKEIKPSHSPYSQWFTVLQTNWFLYNSISKNGWQAQRLCTEMPFSISGSVDSRQNIYFNAKCVWSRNKPMRIAIIGNFLWKFNFFTRKIVQWILFSNFFSYWNVINCETKLRFYTRFSDEVAICRCTVCLLLERWRFVVFGFGFVLKFSQNKNTVL